MLIVVEVVYAYAQSFQSCLTLCDPMDCSYQVPLSMGFSSQEYCSGLSFPPPGESFQPRYWIHVNCIADGFFTHWATWETQVRFSSVQSLSCVQLFGTLWTAACQASLYITNSRSLPKLMSIESVMPSNHLILCHPLLLLPSIFPNIRVFSNESALRMRWPKYWSFSFNISPSNEHPGLISFRMDCLDLL